MYLIVELKLVPFKSRRYMNTDGLCLLLNRANYTTSFANTLQRHEVGASFTETLLAPAFF